VEKQKFGKSRGEKKGEFENNFPFPSAVLTPSSIITIFVRSTADTAMIASHFSLGLSMLSCATGNIKKKAAKLWCGNENVVVNPRRMEQQH
jgi:hypothetical protein